MTLTETAPLLTVTTPSPTIRFTSVLWTDENIEILTQGCEAGDAYSAIAARIPGCTKDACISKAKRLGISNGRKPFSCLKPGQKPKREKRADRPNAGKHVARVPHNRRPRIELPYAGPEPTSVGLSFMMLTEGRCRYPYGKGPFLFCGEASVAGESYCPCHCTLCFTFPASMTVRVAAHRLYRALGQK